MGVAEHPARVVPQNSSIVAAVFLFITIISFQLGVRNFAPNKWGGAERDPGGAQRLTWFMAGQPRRRCDLLRFAEHPRCAGRSAEREHVRVARRQDPHRHLLPAFAFGTKAFVNRSFSGSFFLMTPLLWS